MTNDEIRMTNECLMTKCLIGHLVIEELVINSVFVIGKFGFIQSMSYKVKLDVFEGPLDLLLYLIKKNEIDIYDIPIAVITEQYLEYLELMRMLDLNIAGEFLVIAATLIHIKSKMLLPPDEKELLPEEEEDPREELVRRLVEYKKFKEVAGILQDLKAREKRCLPGTSLSRLGPERFSLRQVYLT